MRTGAGPVCIATRPQGPYARAMIRRVRLDQLTDWTGDRLIRAIDTLLDAVGSDRQAYFTAAGLIFLTILVLTAKVFYRLVSL